MAPGVYPFQPGVSPGPLRKPGDPAQPVVQSRTYWCLFLLPARIMGCWGKGRYSSIKIKPSAMGLGGGITCGGFCRAAIPTQGSGIAPSWVLAEPEVGEGSPKGGCKLFQLILGSVYEFHTMDRLPLGGGRKGNKTQFTVSFCNQQEACPL